MLFLDNRSFIEMRIILFNPALPPRGGCGKNIVKNPGRASGGFIVMLLLRSGRGYCNSYAQWCIYIGLLEDAFMDDDNNKAIEKKWF